MSENFAPIIVFTYLRLGKLKKLISNLKKNYGSKKSDIYIFSDNAKYKKDIKKIKKVRKYINSINGFRKKTIILRNKNFGNGKNITEGVTLVLKKRKSAIILEDDLEIGNNFLHFMNTCLTKYRKYKKIWHIGGWSFDLNRHSSCDIFFSKSMQPWGWATWSDRWKYFERNPIELINFFKRDRNRIYKFNQNGTIDSFKQIVDNYNNKKDTWAIFWSAQIFKNNALCISPHKSLVKSNGFDNFSTHVHPKHFANIIYKNKINKNKSFKFPKKILEDKEFNNDFKKFYYKKVRTKFMIKNFIMVLKKNPHLIMSKLFQKFYKIFF